MIRCVPKHVWCTFMLLSALLLNRVCRQLEPRNRPCSHDEIHYTATSKSPLYRGPRRTASTWLQEAFAQANSSSRGVSLPANTNEPWKTGRAHRLKRRIKHKYRHSGRQSFDPTTWSETLGISKTIVSLVVVLPNSNADVAAHVAYALESKSRIEQLVKVAELQVVVLSMGRWTKFRATMEKLAEPIVWLDTKEALEEYQATLSLQQEWLRQRYPDDPADLVTTQATLNVGNHCWREAALHLTMLLEQQEKDNFLHALQRRSTEPFVSLPFIISTGPPTDQ
jgi:hypothetical protein